MFFPGKLISLKIFSCLPGGFFLLLRIIFFFFFSFSEGSVRSFTTHVCTAAADAQLGPAWSKSRTLRKDQAVELPGFISYIAISCKHLQLLCWATWTSTLPVPELGGSALLPPHPRWPNAQSVLFVSVLPFCICALWVTESSLSKERTFLSLLKLGRLEILRVVLVLRACARGFWTRVLRELRFNILSFQCVSSNDLLKVHPLLCRTHA